MQKPCSAPASHREFPLFERVPPERNFALISLSEIRPIGHFLRPHFPMALLNPILVFLSQITHSAFLRQIAYLKAENQILRSRLPKAVQTTPAERSLLVRLGVPLGSAIQDILGIVHYKTFLRWVRDEKAGKSGEKKTPRHPGRHRFRKPPRQLSCDWRKKLDGDTPGSRGN